MSFSTAIDDTNLDNGTASVLVSTAVEVSVGGKTIKPAGMGTCCALRNFIGMYD